MTNRAPSYFEHNAREPVGAPSDTVEFDHAHPGFEIHAGVVVHFGDGHGIKVDRPTFGVTVDRAPSRDDVGCYRGGR